MSNAVDTLGFIQDELNGLNVRAYNYQTLDHAPAPAPVGEDQPVQVPFAVEVYDDGLDYDADGNTYFDDYPGFHVASAHRTQKGAEVKVAWLERAGIEPHRIRITQGVWLEHWELKYHPIQD